MTLIHEIAATVLVLVMLGWRQGACAPLAAPQLIHTPYYGYDAGIYNQPGYTSKTGSLYDNYYSTPFAYSGLGLGYGAVGALYH